MKNLNLSSLDAGGFHLQYNQILSEVALLVEESVTKEKYEIERQNAVLIQKTLNIHKSTQLPEVDVFGTILSADECSGDWWYSYEKNGFLNVWIGDVTGHGIAAAIVASACRSIVSCFEHSGIESLEEQATIFNESLLSMFGRASYSTFRVLKLNLSDFICEHINGSHPEIFIKTESDCFGIVGKPQAPAGMKKGWEFKSVFTQLPSDFKMYLVTDGFLEIDPSRGRWNYKSQLGYFSNLEVNCTSEDSVNYLKNQVESLYGEERVFRDDITMICISGKKAERIRKVS